MTEQVNDFILECKRVLDGDIKTCTSEVLLSPDEVDDELIKSLNLEEGDLNSNGWPLDFWKDYTDQNENKFLLSGSGWYNNGLTFKRMIDGK